MKCSFSIKAVLLAATTAALAGCATTAGYETLLSSWVGNSADYLVSSWGPPQNSYRLSDGGSVLEYTRSRTLVLMGGYTTQRAVTSYESGTVSATNPHGGGTSYGQYNGTSTTYVPETHAPTTVQLGCTTRFTVNSSGMITTWAHEGTDCIADPPKPNPSATTHTRRATAEPGHSRSDRCTPQEIRMDTCQ